MTTNNSVNSGLSGTTGTGSFVGSTTPTIATPKITTAILDTNGNNNLAFGVTASAVNYVSVTNNASGSSPVVQAMGTDTNIILNVQGQGTGSAQIRGTGTNDNATAGFVGEYISSTILAGAAVNVSNNTATNITSISLTAGDWDVSGIVITNPAAGTTTALTIGWISSTSASVPTAPNNGSYGLSGSAAAASTSTSVNAGTIRITLSATTTVYLSTYITFAVSTMTAYGFIGARRCR